MIGAARACVSASKGGGSGGTNDPLVQSFVSLINSTASTTSIVYEAEPVEDGILMAAIRRTPANDYEPRLVKLGLDGAASWQKTLTPSGITGSAYSGFVAELPGGDILYTLRYTYGTNVATLVRVSGNTVVWQRTFSNTYSVFPRGVLLLPDGNILLQLQSQAVYYGLELILLQPDGTEVSHTRFSVAGEDTAPVPCIDVGGKVLTAGTSGNNGYLIECNYDGSGATFTRFSVPEVVIMFQVSLDSTTGDIYLSGRGRLGASDHNGWVAKFNSSKVVQWSKSFSIAGQTGIDALKATFHDGSLYLAGAVGSSLAPTSRAIVAKLTDTGVVVWAGTYNIGTANSGYSYIEGSIQVVNSNVIAPGYVAGVDGVLDGAVVSSPIDGSHIGTVQNGVTVSSQALEVLDVAVTAETNNMVVEAGNKSTITSTVTCTVTDSTDLTVVV